MLITPSVYEVFRSLFRSRVASETRERRIVIQGMNYAPEVIGVGKYTTQLAQFLVTRGHRVDVVAALPHYPGWRVLSPTAMALGDEARGGGHHNAVPHFGPAGR